MEIEIIPMVQSELGSTPGKAMKIIIACARVGPEARSASYRVCLLFPLPSRGV
jgi:hypothetical protein